MSGKTHAPQLTPQFPMHGTDDEVVLLPVHREAVCSYQLCGVE